MQGGQAVGAEPRLTLSSYNGDPKGNRTPAASVTGKRPFRWTIGPWLSRLDSNQNSLLQRQVSYQLDDTTSSLIMEPPTGFEPVPDTLEPCSAIHYTKGASGDTQGPFLLFQPV